MENNVCKENCFTEYLTADRERKHSRESIYLVHKWIFEGMSASEVGEILNRSEENVLKALLVPLNEGELFALRKHFSPFVKRDKFFLEESCTEPQFEEVFDDERGIEAI